MATEGGEVEQRGLPLADALALALASDDGAGLRALEAANPIGPRDRALVLLQIYDLYRRPLGEVGARVRWQHHPTVAGLKWRLEAAWIAELDAAGCEEPSGGVVQALRSLAAHDRAPAIYRWIADEAPWDSLLRFLALEGGPDDVFDDLVATCQVGLPLGPAKLELARNYWDEMGNGEFDAVHNVLYRRFVDAVGLPAVPRHERPTAALERDAILGLLASNRALQPEMVGALGLIELTAGPRCRYVDQGLARLGAGEDARAFYRMHAVVDPLHGRAWLDDAVGPLVESDGDWGPGILRGATWKRAVDAAFYGWAEQAVMRPSSREVPGLVDRDTPIPALRFGSSLRNSRAARPHARQINGGT